MKEFYRPIYHFTPEKGWMNDPNGLFFYKGKFHMCYQYNPQDIVWDIKSWGHAVSEDLIHWEYLPEVVKSTDEYNVWSGSAVVDYENVSGLKEGEEAPILLYFTGFPKGQMLTVSRDGGKNFSLHGVVLQNKENLKKVADFFCKFNPKLVENASLPVADDRDPKVFWHEESKKWIMVLYTTSHSVSKKPSYGFFSSANLLDWKYESEIENCFEMPDMFRLKVDGTDEYKWILQSANGDYRVGDFDGHSFVPCQETNIDQRQTDQVSSYTWSALPKERVVSVGWIYTDHNYSANFKNFYSVPVDLALRKNKGKYELLRNPIKEFDLVKKEIFSVENAEVPAGENFFDKYSCECPEACLIDFEVEYNPFVIMGLDTPCGRVWYNSVDCSLQYNVNCENLFFNSVCQYMEPENGKIKIRIFIDKTSIEIFGNEGNVYMPYAAQWKKQKLSLGSVGGYETIKVNYFKIYEIKL